MASQRIFYVDELDASKDFVNMKVRILRRWLNPLKKLDMVLIDEKGKKIQATVKKDLVPVFDEKIKEDAVVLIKKFGVAANDDPYPVVRQKLKLNFYKSTEVVPAVGFNGDLYGFNLVPFDKISMAEMKEKNLLNVDVIGGVIWCGNLDIFTKPTGESRRFNMDLKDLDGRIMRCTLWNKYATQFNDFVQNNQSEEHTIAILQHVLVKEFMGQLTLQSDKYGTKIYINEDIQEANEFRRRLIVKEGPAGTSQGSLSSQTVYPNRLEFLVNTTPKHLDEVRESGTTMECVVTAKIAMIETEFGWFFVGCRKCHRKVLTKVEYLEVANEDELTDELINSPGDSIWCRTERKIATQVAPMFKVTVRVQDSTGSASFTMWDKDVSRLIGISATDIRERQLSSNDADAFPHELEGLLNLEAAFKIKVDKYNIKHPGSAYGVIKLCDDPDVVNELLGQDNEQEVREDHTIAEVSAVKLSESSQGGMSSKDAFSVTGESLAAEVEKDTDTSPVQKRTRETPGTESTTKAARKCRKIRMS